MIEAEAPAKPASRHRSQQRRRTKQAAVELEIDGVAVKIAHGTDASLIGAVIAQVLVSKYADHLPLYRQAQIYARQGIQLDRSTLADWVGRAAWYLRPLRDHILEELRRSERRFADETTAPVLDPGRGRTKTGQLWAYARDDRPWGGQSPPMAAYVYAPDRKGERAEAHLGDFAGTLQVDGYGGYGKLEIFNSDQGSPVYEHGVHQRAAARENHHQHGWQRCMARQRRRRTSVAFGQIRGDLSARLRRSQRSPLFDWSISEFLQRTEATFEPWSKDAGSGIF